MDHFFGRFLLCACLGACATLGAAEGALAVQERLIEIFERNQSAIVRVKAAYRQPDEGDKAQVMLRVGSGFFVSREGHVLVSASRAAGADRVWIEYKGRDYAAEAVGHDRGTNVSVLQLADPPEDFSIVPVDAQKEEKARVGESVLTIAAPLDFGPSPSMGVITGRDKKLGNQVFPTEYIRTSISVDAGRGGGPMFDLNGRFLGMSVASIPELDASYFLPAAALARVRDDLLFSGEVIHSWMGFEVAEKIDEGDGEPKVYISRIIEEAPADEAGVREGDFLVGIGGRKIEAVEDVPGAVFFTRANQFTTISVIRDGERMKFSVKTLPRPEAGPIIRSVDGSLGSGGGAAPEAGAGAEAEDAESGDSDTESAGGPGSAEKEAPAGDGGGDS